MDRVRDRVRVRVRVSVVSMWIMWCMDAQATASFGIADWNLINSIESIYWCMYIIQLARC